MSWWSSTDHDTRRALLEVSERGVLEATSSAALAAAEAIIPEHG
jgi:hypothetical protein